MMKTKLMKRTVAWRGDCAEGPGKSRLILWEELDQDNEKTVHAALENCTDKDAMGRDAWWEDNDALKGINENMLHDLFLRSRS